MATKQFTLTADATIQVQALPVNVVFPAVPTGQTVVNVYAMVNGVRKNAGVDLTIKPSDTVTIGYETQSVAQFSFQIPPLPEGVVVTGVYMMVGATRYDAGDVVTVTPQDVVSFHYLTEPEADYEVSVTGIDVINALLDGQPQEITSGGASFTFSGVDRDHNVVVTGAQPRELPLTFDDHGSTTISVNGKPVTNETTLNISDAAHVEAVANPIPVHFQVVGDAVVQIDGREQTADDFTINVSEPTEVDITVAMCRLTIDYGDNSYTISVPQGITNIAAVHRDGWVFDTWTSQDIGFTAARSVLTQVDLTNVSTATVVCNYQRCPTRDKPIWWN